MGAISANGRKIADCDQQKNDHLPKTELYPELPQDMGYMGVA